ncbi:MAG: helix-turn-helix transcriptional regulator [Lachnospiraceae bacterium]|nr:helix-turn-helix transcriptional regulator [Lachnospiraceae bacterium]
MEKLLHLNFEKTMISQLRASDLLNHLLTEYTVEFLKKDQEFRKIPSYIEKSHDLFEEHYEENYSLDDLEARFSISKYRICREFGEYYGITPLQYLNRRRIRIACHLLETTSLRIHEVGSAVGIDNTNHFISLFKKYEGCTPLEYKSGKLLP